MENHDGLKIYVREGMTDKIRLGVFNVIHNVRISLWIERKNNTFTITVTDRHSDDDVEWHVHHFDINEQAATLTELSTEFNGILDYLHENVKSCEHCNVPFGTDPTELIEHGFKSLDLCSDCGFQALYDTRFSKETCCICMDPIGFGHFAVLCHNVKHKIHLGCVREQEICPLCRESNESESEYSDASAD